MIINYIRFINTAIIYIDEIIGFEYDELFGMIISKSEYKNWKGGWKGKEYHRNGKLEFECEYLNGKKWIMKTIIW